MACPTCDHTMQAISSGTPDTVFWCPSCGTIRSGANHWPDDVPKIVPHTDSRVEMVVHLFTNAGLSMAVQAMTRELQRRGLEPTDEPMDNPLGRG